MKKKERKRRIEIREANMVSGWNQREKEEIKSYICAKKEGVLEKEKTR